MVSTDCLRFVEMCCQLPFLWNGILEIAGIAALLFWHVGVYSTLAGVGLILTFLPLQGISGRLQALNRRKVLFFSDKRIKMINEILQAIRLVSIPLSLFLFPLSLSLFPSVPLTHSSRFFGSFFLVVVKLTT